MPKQTLETPKPRDIHIVFDVHLGQQRKSQVKALNPYIPPLSNNRERGMKRALL